MLFSFVGDLDYYYSVLGLPNSRSVNGPCTLCQAQKFGIRSWMDISPHAQWRQSCFTAEGWFESSQRTSCPLFSLPYVSGLNLCYDWMHCKYLGNDQYMYAALMVLLTHYVMPGATPLANLRTLWRNLKTEYERQQTPIRFRYVTSLKDVRTTARISKTTRQGGRNQVFGRSICSSMGHVEECRCGPARADKHHAATECSYRGASDCSPWRHFFRQRCCCFQRGPGRDVAAAV